MNYSAIFSRLLTGTTNSYKYLFLKAITDRVINNEKTILIDDLIFDMLALAWYPSQYFKLSLGIQDKIGNIFFEQDFNYNSAVSITSSSFKKQLKKDITNNIDISDIRNKLAAYVQYRLLTPFFSEELKGKKDQEKNKIIFSLAHTYFESKHPLYKINSDRKSIELNSLWFNFIRNNISIINSYQKVEWIHYLQKNNPNIPAIIYKTEPPTRRSSLKEQQNFWEEFIFNNPNEKCIFTGNKLITMKLSIDHFLPWSFICHDRLWNLIPTGPEINSSKGNNLPNLNMYLKMFIEQQYRAINFHSKKTKNWKKHSDSYVQDLGFRNHAELLDKNKFTTNLCKIIESQYSLAVDSGFNPNWVANSNELKN